MRKRPCAIGRGWMGGRVGVGPWVAGMALIAGLVGHAADPVEERRAGAALDLFAEGIVVNVDLEVADAGLRSLREAPRGYVAAWLGIPGGERRTVGLRVKGSVGSFRSIDDGPSLTVDVARYDAAARLGGLRRIQLNNAAEDPGHLNEWLGAEVFRAANVPAPRVGFARVRLNGRSLGRYVLKEGFAPEFLGAWFRDGNGVLFDDDLGHDVDQPLHVNQGKVERDVVGGLGCLREAVAGAASAARWERLGSCLDRDRFVSFAVLEVMLGHRDGYSLARNNFRIYHDAVAGRFVFLPDGMDQLLGNADLPWKPHMGGLVAVAMMESEEGRRAYQDRFDQLLAGQFSAARWSERVDRLVEALERHSDAGERREWRRGAEDVKRRLAARERELWRQRTGSGPLRPAFVNGIAALTEWRGTDRPEGGDMDRGSSADGLASLYVMASRGSGGSWRERVELEAGAYRFSARGRVTGVVPRSGSRQPGAGLRVAGRTRTAPGLTGDSGWVPMAADFVVSSGTETVELICELNADAGRFWVELASLKLERMDRPEGDHP